MVRVFAIALMPKGLSNLEQPLRGIGYGKQIDKFVLSMNRAAERASPFAKDIFWKTITKATDGLFFVVGQEERKIRKDPAARVTDLLKEVFAK